MWYCGPKYCCEFPYAKKLSMHADASEIKLEVYLEINIWLFQCCMLLYSESTFEIFLTIYEKIF